MILRVTLLCAFLLLSGIDSQTEPQDLSKEINDMQDYVVTQSDEQYCSLDENDQFVMVSCDFLLEKVEKDEEDIGEDTKEACKK